LLGLEFLDLSHFYETPPCGKSLFLMLDIFP